ncbi:MAG: DUF4097 family beta strand repeat-containing protein [Roseburia sp.]
MKQRDEFKAEEVQKLKAKLDCANLVMKEADTDSIIVEAEGIDDIQYSCNLEEGKLKVKEKIKRKLIHVNKNTPCSIVITIPAEKQFEKVGITVGAGNADLMGAKIAAKIVEAESGAGNIVMNEVEALEECNIEAGAGNVRMERAHTENMKISCGVGKFEMNGKVEKNLEAECGVGDITIQLEGKEEDYNFETSCGIGTIRVNGSTTGSFGSGTSRRNAEAAGTIRLNCGVGKIDLTTV